MSDNRDIILYNTEDGDVRVEVFLQDETVWLNQKQISEVFEVDRSVITKHISNIYETNELNKDATCAKIAQVQIEGGRDVKREVEFYNLDMIIAIGYRVNSKKATAFRIWATNTLKEYIIKGFVLDDDRLKLNSKTFSRDYFRELLERIREIRTSERRLYQQLKDLYALSRDYDKSNKSSMLFFAKVQNKVHYAITGKTSAEIIHSRVDSKKTDMGLTNYDGDRVYKKDITIAKNYLEEDELKELRLIVNMFLDIAELRARKREYMLMTDWEKELDRFVEFNDLKLLIGGGKISRIQAEKKALSEYKAFRAMELEKEEERSEIEYEQDIKELEEIERNAKDD